MDRTQSHLGRTKPDTLVVPFPSLDQSLTPFLPAMMTRLLLANVASQLCKELEFFFQARLRISMARRYIRRLARVLSCPGDGSLTLYTARDPTVACFQLAVTHERLLIRELYQRVRRVQRKHVDKKHRVDKRRCSAYRPVLQ